MTRAALALIAAVLLAACERTPVPPAAPASSPQVPPARAAAMESALRVFDRDVMDGLRRLRQEQLVAEERDALTRGTTLRAAATSNELDALAKRIGKTLPPSYRDFLAASNGMLFEGALNVVTMLAAGDVTPLNRPHYPGLAIWLAMPDVAIPLDPTAGGPLPGAALADAWTISSVEDGDVYLIFPKLAGPDGEWPVWFFGPKNPGAIGYRSFGDMLARERAPALEALRRR